ncbi:Glycosyltransferase involved in cell wall bisynthesis [Pseudomonas chlororaphis]|uniref:glycosyltransferase family 2 protein n=1 Tax=Pseudomonas chlororaphis TaxID=587753 RepID=UPI0008794ABF|nr:glycosyltransferase family 2 protein [Pseudomonas chlororaphis]AZD64413.1 Glycosyl transferase [Pseudomonas chlororaphis subsp. aurantiaca]QIT20612.1 glycosyltransferase family 2 protein [Pseudomonas chlororaphis subsp. aurantiaca]WDH04761.1 glycosyltransferase family 2 protein [Pseudomonas chlororaphis]WDH12484.1 glycosyltransferase family 2 protein [Pseudomonas chlororaphis]SDT65618.1 Glycosyltransferase involved in cell wall bisynthesis [Pseudomonas chlororaphis]
MHNPCAVIPVYNHEAAVPTVVEALLASGLPCVLVDDASSPACAAVLEQLAEREQVFLVKLAVNQGKGGAVMAGLREASRLGFSHALQVDADGQHDLRDVDNFIATSRTHPEALVCGYPQYDASVPKGRFYARYLTHVWVWINTLSLQIPDSMCGFRVYPLPPVLALIDSVKIGRRMDFDTDILVRLAWRNQPMRWLTTQVRYPVDGLSHFRLFHDNLLISSMHARLFFGMLLRAPLILWRRWQA